MLGKGLESLIPKKPEEGQPSAYSGLSAEQPVIRQNYYAEKPVAQTGYGFINPVAEQSVPSQPVIPASFVPASQNTGYGFINPNAQPAVVPTYAVPQTDPEPVQPSYGHAAKTYDNDDVIGADFSYQVPIEKPVEMPVATSDYYHHPAQSQITENINPAIPIIVAAPIHTEEKPIEPYKETQPIAHNEYLAEELDYSRRQDAVFQIEVEKIFPNPHQPRKYFDDAALSDLANSIREFGIIQPLVVTKVFKETDTGTEVIYQLIAGERRLMAAKRVGLLTVPVVIKQVSMDRERLELAIIENIQRENLNPLEAGRSYARLQDEFGLTQREIAIRMGKSRETVANTLRLLNLPTEIQQALEEGKINESHARLLLQIDDIPRQKEMFNSILHFKPSVRELKAKIRSEKAGMQGNYGSYANPALQSLQSRLEEVLGTKVSINDEGSKGKITINYYSPEELNGLIERLSGKDQY